MNNVSAVEQKRDSPIPTAPPVSTVLIPTAPSTPPIPTVTLSPSLEARASLASPTSTDFPNPHDETLPGDSATPPSTFPSEDLAVLATVDSLQEAMKQVAMLSYDPFLKISWCRDVLFLLNREHPFLSTMNDPLEACINLTDIRLSHLVVTAISIILDLSSVTGTPTPSHTAEAIYMRALLAASGAFPDHVKPDPRAAFRGFEAAARAGYEDAWFMLGRDYEKFQDIKRAKACFDRGVKLGSVSCLYVCPKFTMQYWLS